MKVELELRIGVPTNLLIRRLISNPNRSQEALFKTREEGQEWWFIPIIPTTQ
jgi:hypothetical protein